MLLFSWLAACGDSGADADGPAKTDGTADTGPLTVELVDVGTACARGEAAADPAETTFPGDAPFEVSVELADCASGCASDIEVGCDVRLVGGEIVVSASASWSEPRGNPVCPLSCTAVVAICPGPELAPGYWGLDYAGGHSDGFTVPATIPVPCATAP
jgi:hypothetical protein